MAAAKTTKEQLTKLEAALRAVDPKAKAAAPSAKAIAKIVSLTGALAADVKALWSWGFGPRLFATGALGMDGEEEWLSAAESASHLADLRSIAEFPKTFIPLASDGAGNFVCFDAKTGSVRDWDHEVRAHRLLAKTLASYLEPRRVTAERAVREWVAAAKEKETAKARAAKEKAAAKTGAGRGAKAGAGKTAKTAAGKGVKTAAGKGAEAPARAPRGIRKVTSPHLTRFDSKGFAGGMEDAGLSNDGRWVAFSSKTKTYLFDRKTEKEVRLPEYGGSSVLAFDPESTCLLRCRSSTAELVDTTGKVTHAWEAVGAPKRGAFSPDGSFVYLLDDNAGVAVWRVADLPKASGTPKTLSPSATLTPKTMENEYYYCNDVAAADDGTLLMIRALSIASAGELTLWNPATKKTLAIAVYPKAGRTAALAPDGQRAAVGTSDGRILILDGALNLVRTIAKAHSARDGVYSVRFDPSGAVIVSAGEKELKVWDAATGKPIATQAATSRNHVPRLEVGTVTRTHVVTSEPLLVFEFKF